MRFFLGKPFICIGNAGRGLPRFESLAGLFHLEDRFVHDAEEIEKRPELLESVDYKEAHENPEKRAEARKEMAERDAGGACAE